MYTSNHVDVVIIGAGLSGLAAAHELKKADLSFGVLEARERSGGRLFSLTEVGFGLDLGAQWVSSSHLRVIQLIDEYGLKLISTYQKGKTIYEQSGSIKKVHGSFPQMSRLAIIDLFKMKRNINHIIKQLPEKPWKSDLGQSLDKITMQNFVDKHMFSDEGKKVFALLAEEEMNEKLHNVSALDVLWFIKSAGNVNKLLAAEQFWIEPGATALVKRMIEHLQGRVFFGKPVSKIEYGSENVVISSNGERWEATKVIITAPPNIVRHITFDPRLPKDREELQSLATFPFVIKMVLIYDRPFWREEELNGSLYSDKGPISFTMDSTPEDEIFGVLTVLIGGENAKIFSKMGKDYRKQETLKSLVRFYGKKAATPIRFLEKDWSEEKWTGGGYGSHFPPGVLTKYGSALSEPIGPIHWAGTETANEWRIYMEGAIQSGQRAAEEVIKSIKMK
ncbi:FAD-dependent oxidoreductase [Alkalihalobacillus sp. BA299]|uniref:flavin monoamine oxidase family protein n=1 Tax=Alkalihalobacillus sp. BA299 TaxID=2815938 RepID=UPI001ADA211F|nr:FAD-dependent oxidoreductase [Alkalihalobacillus sp. BA299]